MNGLSWTLSWMIMALAIFINMRYKERVISYLIMIFAIVGMTLGLASINTSPNFKNDAIIVKSTHHKTWHIKKAKHIDVQPHLLTYDQNHQTYYKILYDGDTVIVPN